MLESFAPLGAIALSWMLRASVILVVALLAVRLLERRSAALRHAVLTAAVIAALVTPPLSMLRLTTLIPANVGAWLSDGAAPGMPNVPSVPIPPSIDAYAPGSPLPDPVSRSISPWSVAPILWLAGVGSLVLRIVIAAIAASHLRRRSRRVSDLVLIDIAQRIEPRVALRTSARIAAPATLGYWRPTILLPIEAGTWGAERLRAVLAHELAHVERRDCLTSLIADVACAVYWVNPFAWLVARRMVLERERACDDRALATGMAPTQYGLLLLDVARAAFHRSSPLASAVISMARPRELESRLLSIVRGSDVERGSVSRRAVTVIGAMAALLGTLAATHVQSQPPRFVGEPDRRGDSVASPSSERVPMSANVAELEARVRGSSVWHGPDSLLVRELASHLSHQPTGEEDLVRDRAIWALSQARGNGIVEAILEALGDDDWRVRAYAAWTLARAREQRAVPALLDALEHPIWRLRAMAAWALRAIGDPRATEAMKRRLADEAWQVRSQAVEFIAMRGGPEAAAVLLPLRTDRHIMVRNAVEDALRSLSSNRTR